MKTIRLSNRVQNDNIYLVFTQVYGGEVFVTVPDSALSAHTRRAFLSLGQASYEEGPVESIDTYIRDLNQEDWDAFRQVYDVREAYSINHTWQPIRDFGPEPALNPKHLVEASIQDVEIDLEVYLSD